MKDNWQKGFTIIELLAVLIVIVSISGITLSLIFSTLRVTDKTTVTNTIRQNGDFALQEISRNIRYAQAFYGVSKDNVDYVKDCSQIAPTDPYSYIKISDSNDVATTYGCTNTTPSSITSATDNGTGDLVNTKDVLVTSCYFTCAQEKSTDPIIIGINFTLTDTSSSNFAEKKANISFGTTITMRNPNK